MTNIVTRDHGKVRLGDTAPAFAIQSKPRPVRAGDKVTSDAATQNDGKVRLGDTAPIWR